MLWLIYLIRRNSSLFFFKIVLLLVITFSVFRFMIYDLYIRYDMEVEDMKVEQKNCMKEYYENRCHFETRVPASEKFCVEKEKCLNKNPERMGISSFLFAKISGQFFRTFLEEFDWKSLIFFSFLYVM